MQMKFSRTLSAVAVLAFSGQCVQAQWTARLAISQAVEGIPVNGGESWFFGIHEGRFAGAIGFRGGYLDASTNIWVPHQPTNVASISYAIHGDQQVGYSFINGRRQAGLWSETTGSWVILEPAGATFSEAWGVHGGQQVGYATINGRTEAGFWHDTAESWTLLGPEGSQYSVAYGVYNGQQVGSAGISGRERASLWNGTADSWVDLHPLPTGNSRATGIHNGSQVGHVRYQGVSSYASLWYGTADSWVNLNPEGSHDSKAVAVFEGWQVGHVMVDGKARASFWSGSAESWEDLSLAFSDSPNHHTYAQAIWADDTTIYVAGYMWNTVFTHAMIWTRPIPAPSGVVLFTLCCLSAPRRRR